MAEKHRQQCFSGLLSYIVYSVAFHILDLLQNY